MSAERPIVGNANVAQAEKFAAALEIQFTQLFTTPKYAVVARQFTPARLAKKTVNALCEGAADKNGEGVQAVLKELGIKNTYQAIRKWLQGVA